MAKFNKSTFTKVNRLVIYPAILLLAGYTSLHYTNPELQLELSNDERVGYYDRLRFEAGTNTIESDVFEAIALELDFSVNKDKWLARKDHAFKTLIKQNAYLNCILITAKNESFFYGDTLSGVANLIKVNSGDQLLIPFEVILTNGQYTSTRLDSFNNFAEPNESSKLLGKSGECNAISKDVTYLALGAYVSEFSSLSIISTLNSYIMEQQ